MGAIGQAFMSMMAATPAITAIVSNRVYPAVVRQADKAYPLITYTIDNTTTINSLDGTVNPLRSCNLILACIANTYADADALAAAILTALDGASGTWGDTTVQGCFLNEDSLVDDVVTEPQTEEIMFYVKEISFLVWYVA